jgi:DNA polymerase delta subunit 1
MSWIKIKKNNYKHYPNNKLSNCQIEIWTDINNLIKIPLEENNKIAPLRILSIDIECSSENSKFPIPQKDPIIVISNILFEFNDKEKKNY